MASIVIPNRRVRGDIGNMINRFVSAKPKQQVNPPVTKGFCEQLLANGEACGIIEGTNKKRPAISADEVPERKVSNMPSQKNVDAVKPTPPTVRIDAEEVESSVSSPSVLDDGDETNKGQTMDIDAGDVGNQLAAVEYVSKFYKSSMKIHDYMDSQVEINERMRMVLVDWLVDVHYVYKLSPETLYLTVQIIDRYLSTKKVHQKELQLLGITSLLIASKYEKIGALRVNDMVCMSDRVYSKKRVLGMERSILSELGWSLTGATPYGFLVRFVKAAMADEEMENMVFFLAELGLMQYSMVKFCPSMFAASAVYAARCILNKTPLWDETLLHTGYSESQLKDCAEQLMRFHSESTENKVNAVYRKYSASERWCGVALHKSAKKMKSIRFWVLPCYAVK